MNKYELVASIMAISAKLNRDDFNVFCEYSGHTDSVYVYVSPNGWKPDSDAVRLNTVSLSDDDCIDRLISLKDKLETYSDIQERGGEIENNEEFPF